MTDNPINGNTPQSPNSSPNPDPAPAPTPAPTQASSTQPKQQTDTQKIKQQKADKKADKAARRARDKGEAGTGQNGAQAPAQDVREDGAKANKGGQTGSKGDKKHAQPSQQLPARQRRQSQSRPDIQAKNTHGQSQQPQHAQQQQPQQQQQHQAGAKDTKDRQVSFFSHLYNQTAHRSTLHDTSASVHPVVQTLALQISHYLICGSHARCAATLLALKAFIKSYTTPPSTSLPRHLSTTALSPQLTHLKTHARPFSTAQSAAIRWLKNAIATLDPALPDDTAKAHLTRQIDTFIRERLTVADQVIAEAASSHIRGPSDRQQLQDGDQDQDTTTVLTFANSAAVKHSLAHACRRHRKRFHVLAVDARPLHEGRALARSLATLRPAVSVTLVSLTGLAAALATLPRGRRPSVCLLGAHTVLANGSVLSRAGTAVVAMLARDAGVPVHVCAESVKFSERAAVDAVGLNELAPEEELQVGPGGDGGGLAAEDRAKNVKVLNLMYDVTPAGLMTGLITEMGSIGPGSAMLVQRMASEKEERSGFGGGGVGGK